MGQVETKVVRVAVGDTRRKLGKYTSQGWRVVSTTTFNEKMGITQVVLERDKIARKQAGKPASLSIDEHVEERIARNRQVWATSKSVVVLMWVLAVVSLGYMLPAAIAATRRRWNAALIFYLNFLLGWTVVGWALALLMALSNKAEPGAPRTPTDPAAEYDTALTSPETGSAQLTDDLRVLAELHAAGALSDGEFAAAKARLLR